ncbi:MULTISPECIES: hypothetical protein [Rodentibacter]|uniref:hypothetical protein n=1 Tax=Rodentibacter TaxID=1960084 RepID=UPI00101ADF33|nr:MULTISPECIES: hypothetical protein [Rodentibacter]QIA76774.1 hypothetical protein FEE42_05080 [Rodentibacter heylii]
MNISLHQSCLDLFKNAKSQPHRDSSFINEFSEQARFAWESREEGSNIARFIFSLPNEYGQRFHFFTVSPYSQGSDILSVRG